MTSSQQDQPEELKDNAIILSEKQIDLDDDEDSFGGNEEGSLEELLENENTIDNLNNVYVMDLGRWTITFYFLRIYLLLILFNLYIIGLVLINILIPQVKQFNINNFWGMYVSGAVTVFWMPLVYVLRRRTPFNLIAVILLVTCFGWTLGFLSSLTNSYAVVAALTIGVVITMLLMLYVTCIHSVITSLPLMMAFVLVSVIMSSTYSLVTRIVFDHGLWWHIIFVMISSSGVSLYLVVKSARVFEEYQYGQLLFAFISFFDLIDTSAANN